VSSEELSFPHSSFLTPRSSLLNEQSLYLHQRIFTSRNGLCSMSQSLTSNILW
jgi:hypothetical protein